MNKDWLIGLLMGALEMAEQQLLSGVSYAQQENMAKRMRSVLDTATNNLE